jgi:hypothetical protein
MTIVSDEILRGRLDRPNPASRDFDAGEVVGGGLNTGGEGELAKVASATPAGAVPGEAEPEPDAGVAPGGGA